MNLEDYYNLKTYLENPPVTIVPTFNTFGVWETEVIGMGVQQDFQLTTDNMDGSLHDKKGLYAPTRSFTFYDCYHGVGYRVKPGFRKDLRYQLQYLIAGYRFGVGEPRWIQEFKLEDNHPPLVKGSRFMVCNSDLWHSVDGIWIPSEMYTDHIINILNRNIEKGSIRIRIASKRDRWDVHDGFKIIYKSKSHKYSTALLRKLVHEVLARDVFFNELAFVKPARVMPPREEVKTNA